MTYSSAEVIAIMVGIGVLITTLAGAIVTVIVALRNGNKTDAVGVVAATTLVAADKTLVATQGLDTKITHVQDLTNANFSAMRTDLATARKESNTLRDEIAVLTSLIADLKAEREKLAIATAAATIPAAAILAPQITAVPTGPPHMHARVTDSAAEAAAPTLAEHAKTLNVPEGTEIEFTATLVGTPVIHPPTDESVPPVA